MKKGDHRFVEIFYGYFGGRLLGFIFGFRFYFSVLGFGFGFTFHFGFGFYFSFGILVFGIY